RRRRPAVPRLDARVRRGNEGATTRAPGGSEGEARDRTCEPTGHQRVRLLRQRAGRRVLTIARRRRRRETPGFRCVPRTGPGGGPPRGIMGNPRAGRRAARIIGHDECRSAPRRLRVIGVLLGTAVAAVVVIATPAAAGEITGGCTGTINGRDATTLT